MNRGRKGRLALNHETLRVLSRSQLSHLGGAAAQSANYNTSVVQDDCNDLTKNTYCVLMSLHTCPKATCFKL